jgi:hypothetical protein
LIALPLLLQPGNHIGGLAQLLISVAQPRHWVPLDKREVSVKQNFSQTVVTPPLSPEKLRSKSSGNLTRIIFRWRLLAKIVPPTIDTA